MKKYCVYTVLLGNYEVLNEQRVAKDSSIDFICFTDNAELKSNTWEIKYINPVFPCDLARSSRIDKLCPHRRLSDYNTSLYIDNRVQLKVIPEIIFHDLLKEDFEFALMKHSFRNTVLDEFDQVFRSQYDDQNTIIEQLNAYSIISPEIISKKPYWGGFLLRRHNNPSVIEAMEDWLFQVLRYSRRDQLSLNYICNKHNLQMYEYDLDIQSSIYHQWPVAQRLGQAALPQMGLLTNVNSNIQIKTLKSLVAECEQSIQRLTSNVTESEQIIQSLTSQVKKHEEEVQTLTDQITMYSSSRYLRITRPLREMIKVLKGKINS